MAKKKILIIEDEPSLIKSLQIALEPEYETLISTEGKPGFKLAKEQKPDLILLDVMLPDTDGIEVLKNLRTDEKTDDIPVIISTNLADQATVSRILAAGGKEYIVKSDWGINDIIKKIEQTLEK